jgi:hypothetical protein
MIDPLMVSPVAKLIEAVDALIVAIRHILGTTEVRQGLGAEDAKMVGVKLLEARVRLEEAKKVL